MPQENGFKDGVRAARGERLWKQTKGILLGAVIGFFLGSNFDTAVHVHSSINPNFSNELNAPSVANTGIFGSAEDPTFDNNNNNNNNSSSSSSGQPSSKRRLLLSELTHNPPAGSLKCRNLLSPIYDRVVQDQGNSTRNKIPKIVHISYNSRCVPTEVFGDGIQQWKDELPDYSVYFHDDDAVDRLFEQDWPEFPGLHSIMRCMKYGGAMKVDLWRMLVVYEFGGIYTDIDNIPAKEFRQGAAIDPDDTFFASSDSRERPCQNVFAIEPHHPIAVFTIRAILKNLIEMDSLKNPKLVKITGPHAFQAGYLDYLSLTNKKAKLTPGVYKGFMNKTVHKEPDWNWLNPVGGEQVLYKKKNMTKKMRAHDIGGLQHWTKIKQNARLGRKKRKGEDYSCREYLYRLDHPSEENSVTANGSLNRKRKLVP